MDNSMPRVKEKYLNEVMPHLKEKLARSNPMSLPKILKVSLNMGLSEAVADSKVIQSASNDIAAISGQNPIITKARKSIATYKIREGMPLGVKVTLRGNQMYEFIDRLVTVALPRIRDFRGLKLNGFDGMGNYSFGIKEVTIFPEINVDKLDGSPFTCHLEYGAVWTANPYTVTNLENRCFGRFSDALTPDPDDVIYHVIPDTVENQYRLSVEKCFGPHKKIQGNLPLSQIDDGRTSSSIWKNKTQEKHCSTK